MDSNISSNSQLSSPAENSGQPPEQNSSLVVDSPDFLPLGPFLSLVNKAQRKDLFSLDDLRNLRLVSKEIKDVVDATFPFEHLAHYTDLEKIATKPAFSAHVKTLRFTNFVLQEDGHYRHYSPFENERALQLMKCYFPNLEELRVSLNHGAEKLIIPYLVNFPKLRVLELHDGYEGDNYSTYNLLAKLPPMNSLKELYLHHNLSFGDGSGGKLDEIAKGLANNFQGLTKLDLRIMILYRGNNLWEMFDNVSLPSLEDLTLSVLVDYNKQQQPTPQNFNVTKAPVWPKLQRLSLLQSDTKFTYEVLSRLPQLSFTQHLTSLEINPIFYHKNKISYPGLLPALAAAGCLEEFICYDWDPKLFSFKDIELFALKKLVLVTYGSIYYEDWVTGKDPALKELEIRCRALVGLLWGHQPANSNENLALFPALTSVKISDPHVQETVKFLAPLLDQVERLELRQLPTGGVEKVFGNEAVWPNLKHLLLGGECIMKQFEVIKVLPDRCPALENLEIRFEERLFQKEEFFDFFCQCQAAAQSGVFTHLKNVRCYFNRHGSDDAIGLWPEFSGKHETFWERQALFCDAAKQEPDRGFEMTNDMTRYLGIDSDDEDFF